MNTILNIYFSLPHDKALGIVSKAFNRVVAKIVKRYLDKTVPSYFLMTQGKYSNGLNTEKRDKEVIVSFTSFPGRIQDVWIVVECLFRQTYKADKIILWLSESQFEGIELPKVLLEQQNRGLEIRFVENDLKSHKKYLYVINEFPNDYVITVDDDLYFDNKLIENLIKLKIKYPDALPTNRAHFIQFNKKDDIELYAKWHHNYDLVKPSLLLVPTGGFGTLYESRQLNNSFDNHDLIKKLAPHADDLWLKVQSILKDTPIITNSKYNKDPITVKSSQLEKLVSTNVLNGGNDEQLKSILEYFNLGNLEKYREANEK
jgi:hypothetical protein